MEDPPHGAPRPIDEDLVDQIADRLDVLRDYFRLEVEGLDRVPEGGAVMIANHTGTLALDGVMLYLVLRDALDRNPRIAVHPSFFRAPVLRDLAARVGLFEVSVTESTRLLDEGELLLFFPEGEDGNLKPFWRYYQLQDFHPGFSRVALAAEAAILPVVIVGGEDANPALGQVRWFKRRFGVPLGIPLSPLPLPAKWRVRFLDPLPAEKWTDDTAVDRNLDQDVADDLREHMQVELDRLVDERGNPFL